MVGEQYTVNRGIHLHFKLHGELRFELWAVWLLNEHNISKLSRKVPGNGSLIVELLVCECECVSFYHVLGGMHLINSLTV